jgi:hypothetical protein
MPVSSIVKTVGLVAFVAVVAVMLIERTMVSQGIPRFFHGTEAEPAQPAVEPPAKPQAVPKPRKRRTPKTDTLFTATVTVGDWRLADERPDAASVIKPGLKGSQLFNLLGTPSFRTTQMHDGNVLERYIYIDPTRSTATVAILENGNTVRSETHR